MAKVPNAVEILPKMWTAWLGCTSVTDRRQTDGRQHIVNVNVSSRSLIKISSDFQLKSYNVKRQNSNVVVRKDYVNVWLYIFRVEVQNNNHPEERKVYNDNIEITG